MELAEAHSDTAESANEKISRALESGDFLEASRLVTAALERWPAYVRLQLTKGEVLARSAGAAAGAAHYASLLDDRPAHPWALGRLKMLLPDMRVSAAEATPLGEALAAAHLEEPEKQILFTQLLKAVAPEEQYDFLKQVAPTSKAFGLEWKLAIAETERGNVDAAIEILTMARDEGRSNQASDMLLSDLFGVCSRVPEAIALLDQAMLRAPDSPEPQRRLLNMLQRACDFKRAGDIIESAAERWPDDWMILFRLNKLPVEPERFKAIFHKIAPTADAAAARDDRFRFQFAIACLYVGEIDRAFALLADPFTKPVDSLANPVNKVLGARPRDFWRNYARLKDNRTLDVQIARSEGARMTVVIPVVGAFGYVPPAIIDALFAEAKINVVYLRDFRKRNFLHGVQSLGRDEEETIRTLKRLVASLGTERVVTMGSCAGGFAALRYGALLGAVAALSFAGPTELTSVFMNTKSTIWDPLYFVRLLIQRDGGLPVDLVPFLSQGHGDTRFFQFYGEDSEEDVWHSRRLEGVANVAVMPVRGVDNHAVVDYMIADGSFDSVLQLLAG